MNRCASIKSLMTIPGIDREKAKLIRSVWLADFRDSEKLETVLNQCPLTRSWYQSCYNTPKNREIKRAAIDEILETFGVEMLGIHRRSGNYVEYCNAGDTYASTVIFHGRNLSVGCWGDMVERNTVETDQEKIQRSFYS